MTSLPDGFHADYAADPYQPGRVRWTLHAQNGALATGTEADQAAAYAAVRGACAGVRSGMLLGLPGSGDDTATILANLSGVYPVLQYFTWSDLPPGPLQSVSRQYAVQAARTALSHPDGRSEITAALNKLLEAKNCAVHAELATAKPESQTP